MATYTVTRSQRNFIFFIILLFNSPKVNGSLGLSVMHTRRSYFKSFCSGSSVVPTIHLFHYADLTSSPTRLLFSFPRISRVGICDIHRLLARGAATDFTLVQVIPMSWIYNSTIVLLLALFFFSTSN